MTNVILSLLIILSPTPVFRHEKKFKMSANQFSRWSKRPQNCENSGNIQDTVGGCFGTNTHRFHSLIEFDLRLWRSKYKYPQIVGIKVQTSINSECFNTIFSNLVLKYTFRCVVLPQNIHNF